jgi:Fe-S-cluster-containing dehydrogenase component/formate-dependent nitrite reductase membrane component NrfD
MTRLGFVLASDSCIGCHACTVACKSEHDVPLGVNRTWVKYIESGEFPATTRAFTVMRCNQCDDAPCVSICPTKALYRAPNGIVDFDDSRCIGCKACMNACPYDAIYINPETNTAHKCNYCNHRVEVGLEPACVTVCPTHAIITGDLDDPTSQISQIVARDRVAVRAPEQATRPKVFYRGVSQAALDPMRTIIEPDGMIWADTTAGHPTITPAMAELAPEEVAARTTYTTAHPATWGTKVSAYLVTKAIAAGSMLVAAFLVARGHSGGRAAVGVVPAVVAGVFTAITGVLLVVDLKQPKRFWFLISKPNTSSWLVRGAWILGGFALVTALWGLAGIVDAPTLVEVLALPTALLAAGTAGYTAFLFGQCEGRDLWQTPLLLPILLAQAVVAGGAAYSILDLAVDVPDVRAVRIVTLAALAALAVLTAAEVWLKDGRLKRTRNAERATAEMTRGRLAARFWVGGIAVGIGAPALLWSIAVGMDGGAAPAAVAGALAVGGLFWYEDAFVRAGQAVPLS